MVEDESVKKIFVFGGIAFLLIVLALLAMVVIGALFFFFYSGETNQPGPETTPVSVLPPEKESLLPQSNPSSASGNDSLWEQISLPLVEITCLSQAKAQAGDLAWAVSSCDCSEKIAPGEKNYDCTVSALDGAHPLVVDCFKEEGTCRIYSEKGEFEFTFEQLHGLI